jgi:hypothetical protein
VKRFPTDEVNGTQELAIRYQESIR